MMIRMFAVPFLATSLFFVSGCANKDATPPVQAPVAQPTSATITQVETKASRNVYVADDITRACKIEFNDMEKAPKFDFDQSVLLPQDRGILEQVAACLTTGPLKGRAIKLVGRADPRGEVEYNMALGEHRSGSAREYLSRLGVDKNLIADTSRGKLDATGTDAAGWERDRRVDILLQ